MAGYDGDFDAVYIPKARASPNKENHNSVKPILQTYPPLGQATLVGDGHINIRLVLQTYSHDEKEDQWEVLLWHSIDESGWSEASFHQVDKHNEPHDLQDVSVQRINRFYEVPVDFQRSLKFTLKFRQNLRSLWVWVRDEHGFDDGIIVRQVTQPRSKDLGDFLGDLNPEWKVTGCLSESPGTQLWSLKASIPLATDDKSGTRSIRIASPPASFLRWFALVRQKAPWIAPRQGRGQLALQEDAVLCAFLGSDGRHVVFLAVSSVDNVTAVLQSDSDGALLAYGRSDADADHPKSECTILVAEGIDFNHAVAAVTYYSRKLRSQPYTASEKVTKTGDEVKTQWYQKWNDGLGYCTWNSLGQDLTENTILNALDDLARNDINISTLIIDDNWQSIDAEGANPFQRSLLEFEANTAGFPDGLKATVSRIKKNHPNILHIGVWHALLGYWGGISPDGKLAKSYQTIELDSERSGRVDLPLKDKITAVSKDDVGRFYKDFYAFLEDAGITAVKTDAQFMVDNWSSASARRELLNEYFDAWIIASLIHFSMDVVSCMSLFPQAVFYSQLQPTRPSFRVRTSDDFFPHILDSHAWHVWANAQNCIFMQYLNIIPDWDMFQSVGDYAGFHAAARCVSGGPVYITDVPGKHDLELLKQIAATNPLGRSTVFRPSVVGRSLLPFAGYKDGLFLQIGSYHGASGTGTSILGTFNVSDRALAELIPLSLFPGVTSSTHYVVRAHSTGRVTAPISPNTAQEFVTCSLDVQGYEIFSAFPLVAIQSNQYGEVSIANLGLLGKMTGCAAVISNRIERRSNGRLLIDTNIKAFGVLGLYVSTLRRMTIDDFMVTIQEKPIPPSTVSSSSVSEFVLEIDVERAFKEMKLDTQWYNEVEVKIYFTT
ncbi:hypothetical protein V2G26_011727 [Clonostachys chloroleuca]